MSKHYYHVYLTGMVKGSNVNIQGPTVETDEPIDKEQRQKMVQDFFKWIKGPDTIKRAVVSGEATLQSRQGIGYTSNKSAVLQYRIRKKYGDRPIDGLKAYEYEKILSGKRHGAKWFKD